MSETEKELEKEQSQEETSAKEEIYVKIGDFVKEKTGKRIGKTGGREIFDLVVEAFFAAATKDGSFRFNGGFGSFRIKTYQAGERRLPSGETTKFDERQKLRYEEGIVVKALVANGGNLADALKVRGTRTTKEVTKEAGEEAKANVEPTGELKEGDDDLNLD